MQLDAVELLVGDARDHGTAHALGAQVDEEQRDPRELALLGRRAGGAQADVRDVALQAEDLRPVEAPAVAVLDRGRAERGEIRPRARLGVEDARELLSAREGREVGRLLLRRPGEEQEEADDLDRVHVQRVGEAGADELGDHVRGVEQAPVAAAVLGRPVDGEQAEPAELAVERPRVRLVLLARVEARELPLDGLALERRPHLLEQVVLRPHRCYHDPPPVLASVLSTMRPRGSASSPETIP